MENKNFNIAIAIAILIAYHLVPNGTSTNFGMAIAGQMVLEYHGISRNCNIDTSWNLLELKRLLEYH
jgi:hypothetical protein